ncbi:MAG: hypothetical protein EXS46_01955 [Candidatus Taylorbacteria bacterium]|nr:hypothetical protein [Candidatus Taylorbacteria bacterium]
MNKNNLIIILMLTLAIVTGYCIGLLTTGQYNTQEISISTEPYITPYTEFPTSPVATNYEEPQTIIEEKIATYPININWIKPIPSKGFGIFKKPTSIENAEPDREVSAKYYKIGTVIDGKYKDGELYMAITVSTDPGGEGLRQLINRSGKITIINLTSDDLSQVNRSYLENSYFDKNKVSFDYSVILPELDFPKQLTNDNNNYSLEWGGYSIDLFDVKYKPTDLKLAFTDSKFGKFYLEASEEKNSDGSIKKNGFYVKAPDGTIRVYSLDIAFYDKNHHVPQITWNNGEINTSEYIYTDAGGCGARNLASVIPNILIEDLKISGKTTFGDNIYELRDTNSSILKKIYENDYNPYDAPKKSYAEFIKSQPAFFWFDQFERLIKFQKMEFIPQAECGKPVIYLYPTKKTDISVKVEPKGGFSKTEPEYGEGWNVKATPEGILTEISTGKTYPYLFWEGSGGIYETPKKGFVIAKNEVHNFLVEKLTKLGLNNQEQKDFMEFWEPRMTDAPYFFVTFLGNKQMDILAPLTISPKPDTTIRILMDFSPLQKPEQVEGFEIRTPERKGFTVVEWGGVVR